MKKRDLFALSLIASACINSGYAALVVDASHEPLSILQSLSPPASLKEVRREVDSLNITHIRFKQTYNNYPVWGGEVIKHINEKGTLTLDGTILKNLNVDLKNAPSSIFHKTHAEHAARYIVGKYRNKSSFKQVISELETKLIVYNDKKNKAHWAYLISFLVKPTDNVIPERPNYIIDAMTFEIFQQWNNIQTFDTICGIKGLTATNGGGQGGNTSPYVANNNYIYDGSINNRPSLSILRNPNTQVCYLQNSTVEVCEYRTFAPIQYVCQNTDNQHNNVYWDGNFDAVNGGNSPSNDILYGGGVIINLYQTWYGIPVLKDENNNLKKLIFFAHWPADNASWDSVNMVMFFGNGVTFFYPLVSLGVAAHEVNHGFTQQNSALVYSGQSGGLNESFSDMAAMAAEFFTTGTNTWEIGHEVFQSANRALRYMITPSTDCFGGTPGNNCSIDNANQYFDGLDAHLSSGVFNRAFYLIATSPTWTTRKAFDIMVRANRFHWISTTTWSQAACGVITSTIELGYDPTAVRSAFNTVMIDTSGC